MDKQLNRIVILKKNIKGDLSICNVCDINFTSIQPCILCQLRIEKEKKLGRKMTRKELYELFEFLR